MTIQLLPRQVREPSIANPVGQSRRLDGLLPALSSSSLERAAAMATYAYGQVEQAE